MVALDPRTGKVLVMASSPSFDPNDVENDFDRISGITANCTPAAPLLNRASAGLFIPGSTFKVITASAALESRKFGPGSTFYDPGYCTVYGKQVHNFADQDGPEVFGTINLVTGLVHSVNSVFCNIGLKLGARAILDTAKRFGFYETPAARDARGRAARRAGSIATASSTTRRSTRTSTRDAWPSARSGCS